MHARLRRLVRLQDARLQDASKQGARQALPPRALLHAGPPYRGAPPQAVAIAAAQAAVIADLAPDLAGARQMIDSGALKLAPAQDHGVVVPLGMVLAPSMWCFEVGDETGCFYSPVGEGPPPALRFGSDDPICIARARDWCAEAAHIITPKLADVAPVETLMAEALTKGDDCHAVTAAGNALLIAQLGPLPDPMTSALQGNAGFVLGVWMAWAAWKLHASASPIAAIGGNGLEFGWRPRGADAWRTIEATPPRGKFFQPGRADHALGAIGDSAVVDICGFGGQALSAAPMLREEWADVLPPDLAERRARIVAAATGIVDPARVVATGTGPIINLAILDRDGAGAPIGRGIFQPPPALFTTGD